MTHSGGATSNIRPPQFCEAAYSADVGLHLAAPCLAVCQSHLTGAPLPVGQAFLTPRTRWYSSYQAPDRRIRSCCNLRKPRSLHEEALRADPGATAVMPFQTQPLQQAAYRSIAGSPPYTASYHLRLASQQLAGGSCTHMPQIPFTIAECGPQRGAAYRQWFAPSFRRWTLSCCSTIIKRSAHACASGVLITQPQGVIQHTCLYLELEFGDRPVVQARSPPTESADSLLHCGCRMQA